MAVKGPYKHGGSYMPEYRIWTEIKMRCYNKNRISFKYYGGRGIDMCVRWRVSFSAFLEDMGVRPSPKHTVDRIDNLKGYSPQNCRWATRQQQSRNRKCNKLDFEAAQEIRRLRLEGFTQVKLAKLFSVSRRAIRQVIDRQIWKEATSQS
jgi:hypothetical protein